MYLFPTLLLYLKEYRTYFHIGQNYGISEGSGYKAVKWVEDTLVKHPNFALLGRKALMKSDMNYKRPLSKLVNVVQNYKCQRSN
ncbi:DDE superendonuclease family protein [Orientia tsutsugamushi str. TA716]|uniref:DDE superendonuclease family protein n=1 Tax=Orientia tsutsugamushi str. TA716 TaxID=1359175 RepID=A0A0F3PCW2_ORITS|nr:DDE superendonuclease family protein [Orientia tsutsugamushi str. TA716]